MTEKQDVFAGPLAALEADIIGRKPESVVRSIKPIERDPLGKKPNEPGAKLDADKVPVMRGVFAQFPRAIPEVAKVSAYGAVKYSWGGWRLVQDGFERYSDAMARHLCGEAFGLHDKESGLLHAAQVAWNALARLELLLEARASDTAFDKEGER